MKLAPALLATTVAMATASSAFARDLTVIDFGGATQKAHVSAYYQPFEKQTGKKLVAGQYNGGLAKVKAMVETNNVTWDLVELEPPELARGCEEGLLMPIDWKRVAPEGAYIPAAITKCGVGTFVWSTVLAFNPAKVSATPKSWADFWNVKTYPGKRGLRKGAKYTLEFALLAAGVAKEDIYTTLATEAGIEKAFAKLDELKANIQWWEAGAQPPQWLAAGDVVMSSAYNGRIAAARKEGTNLQLTWNGSIYALDYWAVPAGSKNVEEIYQFLKVASAPANQKAFSAKVPYGPAVAEAVKTMTPEMLADMPTAQENLAVAFQSNTEFWVENGEELEERFNVWAAR